MLLKNKTFLNAKRSITLCYVNIGLQVCNFFYTNRSVGMSSEHGISGQSFVYLQQWERATNSTPDHQQQSEELLNNCDDFFCYREPTHDFVQPFAGLFSVLHLRKASHCFDTGYKLYNGNSSLLMKKEKIVVQIANILNSRRKKHGQHSLPCSALPVCLFNITYIIRKKG